ncbi:hypothetical protein Acr_27g0004840 [Actinidia rufa]|uniref:Precursor of CEP9 n=1 Tax=Actinidia rufa TaxID=165716 RepID=A0A7J0H740_9ERIC|nr:hypothetical protein Acr_27g0004840 [Actinidia rufa]
MAYIRLICTGAIFLALIACDEILFTEGRELKAMTKEEYESKQEKKETARQSPEVYNHAHVLPAPYANSGPIIDHSVTGKKDTPQTTKILTQSLVAGYADGFRPTTPGKSPGVGHSFPEQMDDAQTKTKNNGNGVSQTMAGNSKDFRPTMRGHSPGVGHSFPKQIDDAQTKTKNNGNGVSQTIAGNSKDFRPTMRGHSPGVGHSFQSTNAEKNP